MLVGLVGAPSVGAGEEFPAVDQPGVTDTEIRVGFEDDRGDLQIVAKLDGRYLSTEVRSIPKSARSAGVHAYPAVTGTIALTC